jgi:hypothetical protein
LLPFTKFDNRGTFESTKLVVYAKLAEQLKLFSLPDSRHNVGGAALCCANTAINVKLLSKDNVN